MTKEDLEKENKEQKEKHKQEILDLVLSNSSERAKLEEEKCELLGLIQGKDKVIAALKEYNKYLKRKRQGGVQKQYNKVAIIKQQKDQLTKAKEILEELANMEYAINPPADKVRSLMVKAEQFLKEIEK